MTELYNANHSSSYDWLNRSIHKDKLPPIQYMNSDAIEGYNMEEEGRRYNTPNASSSWLSSYSPKDSCELSYDGEEYHHHHHGQPTPSPTASTERSRSKRPKMPSTRDIHVERNTEGKPPYSYATLIKYAIENSQRKKLTLSEIYQWVIDHYPYYATAGSGWKVKQALIVLFMIFKFTLELNSS
jgi:hypothetical protein